MAFDSPFKPKEDWKEKAEAQYRAKKKWRIFKTPKAKIYAGVFVAVSIFYSRFIYEGFAYIFNLPPVNFPIKIEMPQARLPKGFPGSEKKSE